MKHSNDDRQVSLFDMPPLPSPVEKERRPRNPEGVITKLVNACVRCSVCGSQGIGTCDCWVPCECGWIYEKGTPCRNPAHVKGTRRRRAVEASIGYEPGAARGDDPDTSQEAAERINVAGLEDQVVATLIPYSQPSDKGLTSREVCILMGEDWGSISNRFRPLARKGRIVEAGFKQNPSGLRAIAWKAVLTQEANASE